MKQIVQPIKDSNVLEQVQETLLDSFKWGRRNYTVFQLGKATLLRVSDVLSLKYDDVYDDNGQVRSNAYIHDKKTGKANILYLKPVADDLKKYLEWLKDNKIESEWLFPSSKHYELHISERQFYKVMWKVGQLLNINYLGTHTMRKTGAYRVYVQSNYNIGFVMDLLNHSSQAMTLKYLGIDRESKEHLLDSINFG
ncbi:site-specific integrase [Apilactobacillus xinyiensis]|uniref:site-specific integrase n=1 Tax=Apilactobacillus xinyiensis TaxID=2841032 RepID=UPI002010332A|nr:site-specific integrase [Apilactobacillus xinyiensis]MCL0330598.1 site-specific integrase [Apilactobacillus xinyiensis]